MVARHVDFVRENVGICPAFHIHDAAEPRPRRQSILVFTSDFAGATTDAVNVVMHEAQLQIGHDRLIDLPFPTLHSFLNLT
jgi:hypothetical protein